MARTRQIKPGFFLNTDLAELDPLCRLLFIGLWTIADRRGRLEYNLKKIKAQVLPYDNLTSTELAPYLHRLCTMGFLIAYKDDKNSYLQIVNFEKHQHIHRDEKDSEIPNVDDSEVIDPQELGGLHRTCTELAPDNNPTCTEVAPMKHALNPLDNSLKIIDDIPPSTPAAPDYTNIVADWNSFAQELGLAEVKAITSKRKSGIRSRLKQKGFDQSVIYDKIRNSSFLRGGGKDGWKVHFDFVWCSPDKWLYIIEGKYDEQTKPTWDLK